MGFTPDGSLFYLFADDFGEVFDLATHKLVTVFDTFGGHTTGVAVSADGRHVYVSQRPGKSAGGILVIDVPTQKRVDPPIESTVTAGVVASRIELPGSADGLALLPDGVTAYVSDRHARAVRVISLPS
jgi:DNA-binding beta-propeller fold protein YncE